MTVKAEQNTLSTTAEVLFTSASGTANVPNTVAVKNIDAAIVVWLGGGSTVSSTTGYKLSPGESISIDLIASESVWAVAASGTPVVCLIESGN